MQIFVRAYFGMSEIPELRARQGNLEAIFPWSKRITWYLYLSLLFILIMLGSYRECLEYPLIGTLANVSACVAIVDWTIFYIFNRSGLSTNRFVLVPSLIIIPFVGFLSNLAFSMLVLRVVFAQLLT